MTDLYTEVTLSWHELLQGATQGIARHIEAIRAGRADAFGGEAGDGWGKHIEGALGELAVARVLNRYWNGSVNTFKAGGDVGRLQVRTRSRHEWDLLVRENDPDDAVFVLVTGKAPTYRVHGYLRGSAAKCAEWRKTHGERAPAYFVPQSALTRMPTTRRQAA